MPGSRIQDPGAATAMQLHVQPSRMPGGRIQAGPCRQLEHKRFYFHFHSYFVVLFCLFTYISEWHYNANNGPGAERLLRCILHSYCPRKGARASESLIFHIFFHLFFFCCIHAVSFVPVNMPGGMQWPDCRTTIGGRRAEDIERGPIQNA